MAHIPNVGKSILRHTRPLVPRTIRNTGVVKEWLPPIPSLPTTDPATLAMLQDKQRLVSSLQLLLANKRLTFRTDLDALVRLKRDADRLQKTGKRVSDGLKAIAHPQVREPMRRALEPARLLLVEFLSDLFGSAARTAIQLLETHVPVVLEEAVKGLASIVGPVAEITGEVASMITPGVGIGASALQTLIGGVGVIKNGVRAAQTQHHTAYLQGEGAAAASAIRQLFERRLGLALFKTTLHGASAALKGTFLGLDCAGAMGGAQIASLVTGLAEAALSRLVAFVALLVQDLRDIARGNEVLRNRPNHARDIFRASPIVGAYALVHCDTSWVLGVLLGDKPLTVGDKVRIEALQRQHVAPLVKSATSFLRQSRVVLAAGAP